MNDWICADGTEGFPLLGVKLSFLRDGIFLGWTFNHVVADGMAVWHFINCWAEMSRTGGISNPPSLNRWCDRPLPIKLPYSAYEQHVLNHMPLPPPSDDQQEAFFHFSATNVSRLKKKANIPILVWKWFDSHKQYLRRNMVRKVLYEPRSVRVPQRRKELSSFVVVVAFIWKSILRAQKLPLRHKINCFVAAETRRLFPEQLPEYLFANYHTCATVATSVGRVIRRNLQWVAGKITDAITRSRKEKDVKEWVENFPDERDLEYGTIEEGSIFVDNGHRFNIYSNDFGMGTPWAVCSGVHNRVPGRATVFKGPEPGSMGFQICLSKDAMANLLADEKFMGKVSIGNGMA